MRKNRYGMMIAISVSALLWLPACAQQTATEEIVVQTSQPTVAPTPEPTQAEEATPEPTMEAEPTPEPTPKPPDEAPGKKGHIQIDNTNVDYPIMLAEDNEYYLRLDENGKRNKGRGSIFADYRNADPDQQRNIILYGHNLKDRSMFTTLHKYENEAFFQSNPYINAEIFGEAAQYEIVYSGIIDNRKYLHITTKFNSEEEFVNYFMEGAGNAQFVRDGYRPEIGDEMLTLSTCVSHSVKDFDDKRMVVVARKVKPSEEKAATLPLTAQEGQEAETQVAAVPGEVQG